MAQGMDKALFSFGHKMRGLHRNRTSSQVVVLLLSIGLISCTQESAPAPPAAVPPKTTPEEVASAMKLLAQEGEKGEVLFAALDAVRDSAPFVSEFLRLFPQAEVNYRYFTSDDLPGFDVQVELYDRYELMMQLPVRFDAEHRKVVGYGEPTFHLGEVVSQRGNERTYNPDGERRFGSAAWRKIVESGGDFTAIHYTMQTNQPVVGFSSRKTH